MRTSSMFFADTKEKRFAPRSRPADCTVVIAAGAGSRLRFTSQNDGVFKPLTMVLGVPLIVRTLITLRDAGVREAVIVTGYRAEELRRALLSDHRLAGLTLSFAHNPEWRKKNGLSVLAARKAVGGRRFLLSMADHLYSPRVVEALRACPPTDDDLVLAVDFRVGTVTDPEDAMWVRLTGDGAIRDIGKDLTEYDAVDTGVFFTSPALFEALEQEAAERGGDCALADGVRRLAHAGRARTADIGDAWWQDVDTHTDLRVVEGKLLEAMREEEAEADLGLVAAK
ncbi:MAG TPA: NTP transferase domain-containing protein [Vicinamibacteria bacterium]|nr:NTP transferase domain-containing protein [Vicinamibacteria bacterium]